MPRDRSNRIEVDLKLLQDKNVEKLQEFGRQFDKSIDKLASMLGDYAEQVSGAEAAVGRAGKLGPNASTGSGITSGPTARQGGTPPPFANIPAGQYTGGPFEPGGPGNWGGPSIAPIGGGGNVPVGGPGSFEQQFVRAQKRIGEIPVGLRQTLGYIAEGAPATDSDGYLIDNYGRRILDENGNPMTDQTFLTRTGLRNAAGKVNEFMFRGQAARANAMLGYGHLQNFYGGIMANAMLGQQLGRSREGGLFGTGLFSSAWTTGIMESLKTGIESKFGFSPNYSPAQAKQARQALQSFGYSGDTSDYLAGILKDLQIHQGIDAASAMAILDPLMRFGGDENIGQLLSVLRQIPDAAKAAHMNLSEFTQQLVSTSQEVSQSTGMTVGGAARALSAFTTTTGLAPSRAAGLFSSPQNLVMAAGMSGQSITSLMEGKNRMAPRMEFGLKVFQGFTGGYTAEQLAEMRKHDWGKYQSIMNAAWLAYAQNKDIFGGFSPRELINMQVRNNGDLIGHTQIAEQIQGANSTQRIDQMLRGWGGAAGAHMSSAFEKYVADNPHATIADYRKEASDLIAASTNAAQTRTARQITQIDLTPEAKKWFKVLNYDDKPNSNSMPSFERPSSNPNSRLFLQK